MDMRTRPIGHRGGGEPSTSIVSSGAANEDSVPTPLESSAAQAIAAFDRTSGVAGTSAADGGDPLIEIDDITRRWRDDKQREKDECDLILANQSEFATTFSQECQRRVRPPMEAIIERLKRNGGDGRIEERPEDLLRNCNHRLTLWMSISGKIADAPRLDRNPYLQLDANVAKQVVTVSEGDMWEGHGGNRSGPVGEWRLEEITPALVTHEVLEILRRSVDGPPSKPGTVTR